MKILLFIKQAFSSIMANKLRSFLSMLGIIIGISSFVIMLSLGEGAKASILKEFAGSSNVITIQAKDRNLGRNILTEDVSKQIEEKVPGVSNSFAILQSGSFNSTYNDRYIPGQLIGVSQNYLSYKKVELQYGSNFDQNNFKNDDKFVILGNKLVKSVFKKENPIGKKIDIGGELFIVSGLLKEKNWSVDYNMYIPDTTLKKVFNIDLISRIEVVVEDETQIDLVKNDLDYFLFKKSFVSDKKNIGYELRTNKEELKQVNDIIKKFSLLLGGIGAISLIVGGIGIMNIMLVSVTERTKEIGIRKAIGATNGNILSQFLIESIILTLIGSIIAIGLSYGVVKLIDMFIPDFSPLINLNVISIATSVSIFMGILFGLMPAYKAAKLKPIDALHFE